MQVLCLMWALRDYFNSDPITTAPVNTNLQSAMPIGFSSAFKDKSSFVLNTNKKTRIYDAGFVLNVGAEGFEPPTPSV